MLPPLAVIPAGEFLMGESPSDKFANDTERPAHRVSFAQPFALGRFLVTVGEYRAFRPNHAAGERAMLPVVGVSWNEAHAYCAWLSEQTGHLFRLPREAEWEYACRAGTTTPFSTGEQITPQEANFFYDEHGERIGLGALTAVGAYTPNPWGLHDLHGNVCEWVEDGWHPDFLGAPCDGSAWVDNADKSLRVIRGGAWDYLPRLLRSSWRDGLAANAARDNVGFRVASDHLPFLG